MAEGVGAALQPRLSVDASDRRIAVVSLDGVLPPRRIALYWHRERRQDEAIMRFVSALLIQCGREAEAAAL